jgi:hypothetical protein
MATFERLSQQDRGDGEVIVLDATFAASYPQGGEPITAYDLGFRTGLRIDSLLANPVGGRTFQWVPDASLSDRGKLKVLDPQGAEDFLLNRPGLAIGTVSAAEVLIANAITYSIAATMAELASAEHAFTATTHDITADADKIQEAIFLLSVAAGTVTITKGTTADEDAAVPPALPAGEALVGYVKIQVAAGSTDFDATTDDLDAAHLTTSFQDADQEALEATDLSSLVARVTAHGR